MNHERKKINVSNSHVALRTVAFVLAVVLGVAGISIGVSSIGKREPGYYEIETTPSEDAALYASGFTLVYWLDGDSGAIKQELNTLKDLYSAALERSYKLVDPENTYDGYVNLASLNESDGQEVSVSAELFAILTDAWEKTRQGRGFHLFAGALNAEWSSILSLEDMGDFDPAVDSDLAGRLGRLAERTGDITQFDLKIVDEVQHKILVSVDPAYLDFLRENEYCQTVLDLGGLADAYRLELVRNALEEKGYGNGYLTTDSGLTLSLSGHSGGAFGFYGYDGETPVKYAALEARPNSACSYLRVFPMAQGELMYHRIQDELGQRFYHPWYVTATGGFAQVLTAAAAVDYDGDVVGCAYEAMCLYNQESREAILEAASADAAFTVVFRAEPGTVYCNRPDALKAEEGVEVRSF